MKVRFAERAVSDLEEIADYIGHGSPAAAKRVRSAILETIGILSHFPEIGRLQNLADVRKAITRRYSYLIYYRVDAQADTIVILSVRHPARNE